jgi:hypothetical protein
MKNTRIYPLRTSSSIWKIKLYSKHICNDMCKLAYIHEYTDNNSIIFSVIENPDYKEGKCKYSMKLNPSSIQLSEFKKDDPYTIDGELLFFNNIVIPDTKIKINLSFPLETSKNIIITSDNDLGFSLSSLIDKIKKVYKWIYKEEENTSSIKKFNIINQCKCTLDPVNNITNSLIDYNFDNENNQNSICSICLEKIELTKESKKTSCNHIYHKDCIYEWINNDKNTCPLCRKKLFTCNDCNNGVIYTEYIGKVIPKNLRGILNRNKTDGIFKIYGYDFEDLFIDDMIYNSITKTLYPKIFG